jgi:hypothetical protein
MFRFRSGICRSHDPEISMLETEEPSSPIPNGTAPSKDAIVTTRRDLLRNMAFAIGFWTNSTVPSWANVLPKSKSELLEELNASKQLRDPEELQREREARAEEKRKRLEKQREIEAEMKASKDKKQVEIDANLRANYYFPTARKRYVVYCESP